MAHREIISGINPQRILWCCEQSRMSIADLGHHIKVPVKKLESGELTYNQLRKVADYFGHTALFFLGESVPDEEVVHSAEFRELANQRVPIDLDLYKIIRLVEHYREIYIALLDEINEAPQFQKPGLTGTLAKKALAARKWLGINNDVQYEFKTYREAIEQKGILIILSQGYNGNWKLKDESTMVGFSMPNRQVPIIFIKKTSEQLQTFTLFHELGHLLLHDQSHIDDADSLKHNPSDRKETEANQFATQCLLPNTAYKTERDKNTPPRNPSKNPMPRRSRDIETLHIFGRNYVGTILNALCADQITLSKASYYLDRLNIDDIKKLTQSYR